jgi:ribose transport system permease protein
MSRFVGLFQIVGVFLMVAVLYGVLMMLDENARSFGNQQTIAGRLGFYGVLTVGVGVLIVSGGIDLSIGSVVGLGAVAFALLLERHFPPWAAALAVIVGASVIGLSHGLLVTQLRLQPFLVTLCGLFIYRGLARWIVPTTVGLTVDNASETFHRQIEGFRALLVGTPYSFLYEEPFTLREDQGFTERLRGLALSVPNHLILLIGLAVVLGLFLHGTRYGRYLFAIGANEEAARYAGIPTANYKILAYVISSTTAGLGGVLFILENRTANATSAGSLLELYAITGAVLGGCSLSGGEGSMPGMVLGAAVLPLLRQLCIFGGVGDEITYAVIGLALLGGTIVDQLLKRRRIRRF